MMIGAVLSALWASNALLHPTLIKTAVVGIKVGAGIVGGLFIAHMVGD